MKLYDTVTEWCLRYGRGVERTLAEDDLARMLDDMLAELDAGGQSPFLVIRVRFPRHSLAAGALRALLPWHRRRRFAKLWRRYRTSWRQAEGLEATSPAAGPPDAFAAQLRGRAEALLAFLHAS